jgi:hypothetical protein
MKYFAPRYTCTHVKRPNSPLKNVGKIGWAPHKATEAGRESEPKKGGGGFLANRYRGIHTLNVTLLNKDFSCLGTEGFNLRLLDQLAALELLDLTVQVAHRHALFKYRNKKNPDVEHSRSGSASGNASGVKKKKKQPASKPPQPTTPTPHTQHHANTQHHGHTKTSCLARACPPPQWRPSAIPAPQPSQCVLFSKPCGPTAFVGGNECATRVRQPLQKKRRHTTTHHNVSQREME